mmetsp:Transcript_115769/g.291263  ORF Transcript_115769/g.291263 Transcript_115769/m.291263 type:complete len:944 (+) Transcript_115769:137-2968(+)
MLLPTWAASDAQQGQALGHRGGSPGDPAGGGQLGGPPLIDKFGQGAMAVQGESLGLDCMGNFGDSSGPGCSGGQQPPVIEALPVWQEADELADHRQHMFHYHTMMCPQFANGYCPRHKGSRGAPPQCFCFHFENQRRRPLVDALTGQIQYWDVLCEHVANEEECPYGEQCPFAHTREEISYHAAKYKTKFCNDRDCRGQEVCCFAHGEHELRKFALERYSYWSLVTNGAGAAQQGMRMMHNEMALMNSQACTGALYHPKVYKHRFCASFPHVANCRRGDACAFAHTREEIRTPLLDSNEEDQKLSALTNDFFMHRFKTLWCPIGVQHDWQTCVYAHNYQDARRHPLIGYGPRPCPYWKRKETALEYSQRCPLGVRCPFSHGAKEQLYHPSYFKTVTCQDWPNSNCPRGRLCAFWHKRSQQRGRSTTDEDFNYKLPLRTERLQELQVDFLTPPFKLLNTLQADNGQQALLDGGCAGDLGQLEGGCHAGRGAMERLCGPYGDNCTTPTTTADSDEAASAGGGSTTGSESKAAPYSPAALFGRGGGSGGPGTPQDDTTPWNDGAFDIGPLAGGLTPGMTGPGGEMMPSIDGPWTSNAGCGQPWGPGSPWRGDGSMPVAGFGPAPMVCYFQVQPSPGSPALHPQPQLQPQLPQEFSTEGGGNQQARGCQEGSAQQPPPTPPHEQAGTSVHQQHRQLQPPASPAMASTVASAAAMAMTPPSPQLRLPQPLPPPASGSASCGDESPIGSPTGSPRLQSPSPQANSSGGFPMMQGCHWTGPSPFLNSVEGGGFGNPGSPMPFGGNIRFVEMSPMQQMPIPMPMSPILMPAGTGPGCSGPPCGMLLAPNGEAMPWPPLGFPCSPLGELPPPLLAGGGPLGPFPVVSPGSEVFPDGTASDGAPRQADAASGAAAAESCDEMPTHNGFIHFKEADQDLHGEPLPGARPRAASH